MALRSLLFTPANRLDRLDKALAAGPDWVALDLEDGVAANQKAAARDALDAFARDGLAAVADRVAVRINPPMGSHGIRDLSAMLDWPVWPGMLILPKVEARAQVSQTAGLIEELGHATRILVTLESAAGVAGAHTILAGAPADAAVGYGSADHMSEVGGNMDAGALAWGRSQVLNAAACAGIPALDGVWLDFRDQDGLLAEARLVRAMGFAGKIAIHPNQIRTIHEAFSPTAEEVEAAKGMIAAAPAAGGGAFAYRGQMVDAPVLERARRIAEIVDTVEGNTE